MTFIKTLPALLFMAILSVSCNSEDDTKTTTYWVNSLKTECDAGAGKAQCLQVYNGDDVTNATWTLFYAPIEGFSFETGYLQKIKVKETQRDAANVPADASSIKYELVEVIEKKQDKKTLLNDIWAATHINGTAIATENVPTLEINLSKMQALGKDGCNNFSGKITDLNDETLTFGALASTRKMCPDMTIPDQFNQAINQTASYKYEQLTLYLYNASGDEILRFKKVD
ncbi:DUF4377 domain-containing protein [Tamlana crocina]|uniref:DUF4377 domain-containing protein n=1 Tax=Tamlana crocina TaxID=393006 RepID=A0ABX1D8E9_9FLAO|nr:DUF4377 domain-containing protein [Tamlana crocina]NJX14640.1 DUF4377 domain-containing protein [Tamlana crocina]